MLPHPISGAAVTVRQEGQARKAVKKYHKSGKRICSLHLPPLRTEELESINAKLVAILAYLCI